MEADHPNPVHGDGRAVGDPSPGRPSQIVQQDSPDFNAVLRHYGEAMLRLGKLEARAEDLIRQQNHDANKGDSTSGPTLDQVSNGHRDVTERAEALEAVVTQSSPSMETIASPGRQPAPPNEHGQDSGEVRQLRLLNGNLAHRLAQTETLLEGTRGDRGHRRRPKPLWKKIAQRVGLR